MNFLRARKFAENVYYHELARELRGFGYQIRNRARGDFQIEGVSEELCKRFSKRRAEIDAAMAKLLDEKPELAGGEHRGIAARRLVGNGRADAKAERLKPGRTAALWEAQLSEIGAANHAASFQTNRMPMRRVKKRCQRE